MHGKNAGRVLTLGIIALGSGVATDGTAWGDVVTLLGVACLVGGTLLAFRDWRIRHRVSDEPGPYAAAPGTGAEFGHPEKSSEAERRPDS